MMFWRKRREQDLDRELRDHLTLEAEEQDRCALGNLALIKEDVREAWGWMWLDRLWQDARYAIRGMRKSPAFAATAILSLALGIGANTAIFTVVNAVLLKPLPFPQPDRLVQLWETKPAQGYFRNVVNGINFLDWRERTHSFEDMAAVSPIPANLTGLGDPIALDARSVSPQYFSILGVAPALGRPFTAEEGRPGRSNVILSFGTWQSRFGGDRSVLGRKITLNGGPATVVGVMPRGFALPQSTPDLWMPLPIDRSPQWQGGRNLTVVARLKPGVTTKRADDDLKTVAAQLARERPGYDGGWSGEVIPLLADATRNVRLPLLVLLAAVGLVLLIACANVANLLLMRSSGRAREIAVRAALGAGRRRLLQQLLAESLVLALVACSAGLAAAYGGVNGLIAMVPAQNPLPRMEAAHLDGSVLLFALGLSVVTAAIFGLIPSLRISQLHPHNALRQGVIRATSKSALRHGLVIAEIALSLILLTGAGLMLRSFYRLTSVNPGFETQRILTLNMFTSPARYLQPRKRAGYFANVLEEIRTIPGVREAGSAHFLPLQESSSGSCFDLAERGQPVPSTSPDAGFLVVSPGYFQAMGTPLRGGRHFDAHDTFDSASVIMVNQEFASRFRERFGREPIGQKLNVCWGREFRNPAEIIGIVADARQDDLQTPPRPTIFVNNFQSPMFFATLVVRAAGDPIQISRSVQAAIHHVDPDQAITHVETMEQVFSDSVAQPRLELVLLGIFGSLAGLLAMIGVYGVVAYSAAQRTREIGIRMALGALPGDVRRLVLREGALLAAAGAAIGLAGALALTRFMRSLLFETTPNDPETLALAVAMVLTVALSATIIPAHRASRIDPMATLRCE